MTRLQTVVELPEFQRRVKSTMTDDERQSAISFIAANPERGPALAVACGKSAFHARAGEKRWIPGVLCFLAGYICRSFW